jgi:Inner membrane component of T3SS, cytoplasmic domain
MQVACTHCGTKHVLKDAEVTAHPKVQFQCSKCGQPTVVDTRRHPDATMVISPLPSFARGDGGGSKLDLLEDDDSSKLLAMKNVVLTVISGPGKDSVYKLSKPRVVLGREGADIALQDQEISRHHCVLEVREGYVNLRDLDSTNGTFYDEERVRAAMLLNGAEFRVGETLLRITFQPK